VSGAAGGLSNLVPPEDHGAETLYRYAYQQMLAVPVCVDMVRRNSDIVAVYPEFVEDLAIEHEGRWRFIQVKSHAPTKPPWTLTEILESGALSSLWRTYQAVDEPARESGASFELGVWLSGRIARHDAAHVLVAHGELGHLVDDDTWIRRIQQHWGNCPSDEAEGKIRDVASRIAKSKTTDITPDDAQLLVSRCWVYEMPSLDSIESQVRQMLYAKAPDLTRRQVDGVFDRLLSAINRASMAADSRSEHTRLLALAGAASGSPPETSDAKRLDRELVTPLLAPLDLVDETHDLANEVITGAAKEDAELLDSVRELVLEWRKRYAVRIPELGVLSDRLAGWRKGDLDEVDELDDEQLAAIRVAGAVAEDLDTLPVRDLAPAEPFGLRVHPTVLCGQATSAARLAGEASSEENRRIAAQMRAWQNKLGMVGPRPGYVPDRYAWELIERVVNAAVGICHFDVCSLPRGLAYEGLHPVPKGVGTNRCVAIARLEGRPGLHVLSASGADVTVLGSFAARASDLHVLGARINRAGGIEVIAQDRTHTYRWSDSGLIPVMQRPVESGALGGGFTRSTAGSPAVIVTTAGEAIIWHIGGLIERRQLPLNGRGIRNALVQPDPMMTDGWYVIVWCDDGTMYSVDQGRQVTGRIEKWDPDGGPVALDQADLLGLPCVLAVRKGDSTTGDIVTFHDLRTLEQVQAPVWTGGEVIGTTTAARRWLVASMIAHGRPRRLAVWDLSSADQAPTATFLDGANADVWRPVVVHEDDLSFVTLQTYSDFDDTSRRRLVRLGFPPGSVEVVEDLGNARVWPVDH
jgi:Cap4 dsDNA endonuclease